MTQSAKTARLFTTRRYPVRYLVIPKCGCTFIKNLLWSLEHGSGHPNPLRIHDDDQKFLRADALGLTEADIRNEEHAFTIVRKPTDRFLSLYFDKVVGAGHQFYVPLRRILKDRYGLDVEADDLAAHRKNCAILADWLAANLSSDLDMEREAHWTPQSYRAALMKTMDLKMLTLDDLNAQLRVLLGEVIPDLDTRLGGQEKNSTARAYGPQDILADGLKDKINEIYAADRRLYNRTRRAWRDLAPDTAAEVPRYSALGLS